MRPRVLLLLLPLLYGCRDESPLRPPLRPASAISDGAQPGAGHNPHLYFLPPLAPQPAAGGTFNPRLKPWVSICEWASGACVSSGLHRRIDAVRPSPSDPLYQADWDTQAQPQPAPPPAVYRVRVMVGVGPDSLELGFADVQLYSDGKSAKRAGDESAIGLVNGRSLPIKFRIEEGALAAECGGDCAEGTARAGEDFTLVTSTGYAATFIGAGAIPPEVGEVSVLISRRQLASAQACLPFPAQQAEGCYRYETIPALQNGFLQPVRVEVCLDPAALPPEDYRLHKFSTIGPVGERGRVVALAPAISSLVDCTGFAGSGPVIQSASLLRRAVQGWSALAGPIGRLLGPAALYANDIRYGGMTNSFSDVGYARPLGLGYVAGTGQTALPGATLPDSIRVRVLQGRDEPNHVPQLTPAPVAGARVRFRVVQGGGTLGAVDSLDNFTDAAGYATVPWTLGQTTGQQTVIAYVPGTDAPPVTFTATAGTPPAAGGPDLAYGFVTPQANQPLQLWRNVPQTGWVQATGTTPVVGSGEQVELRAYFRNAGDTEVATGFTARMRLTQSPTGWSAFSWPLGTLLLTTQGYMAVTSTAVGPAAAGCATYVAEAELDDGQQVAETSSSLATANAAEINNTAALTYQVCTAQ